MKSAMTLSMDDDTEDLMMTLSVDGDMEVQSFDSECKDQHICSLDCGRFFEGCKKKRFLASPQVNAYGMLTHNFLCVQRYFNPVSNSEITAISFEEFAKLNPNIREFPKITVHHVGWQEWGRFFTGDYERVPKVLFNGQSYFHPSNTLSLYNYLLLRFTDLCRGNPSWKSTLREKILTYEKRPIFDEGVGDGVSNKKRLNYAAGLRKGIEFFLSESRKTKIINGIDTDFDLLTKSISTIRDRFISLLTSGTILGDTCRCYDFFRFITEKGKNKVVSDDFILWNGWRDPKLCKAYFGVMKDVMGKAKDECKKSCQGKEVAIDMKAFSTQSVTQACDFGQQTAVSFYNNHKLNK